jgi:hypothetical protein
MTAIRSAIALTVLAVAVSASAQNQQVPSAPISESQSKKVMTSKEKIQQLKPATNFVELMQLINIVHAQALLIDPYFMEDENILRLFGQGRIEERKDANGRHQFKQFFASENNPFRFPVRFMGAKTPPGYGSLTIGDYKLALPFGHELIEAHLLPGVQGDDPYGPLKPMTNEARNIAGGRPLATHPKGYWTYAQRIKAGDQDTRIYVVLDRNAQALNIDLTQKGTQE